MEEMSVRAGGLQFRCLAAGPESGPLALLLHGFPEGKESWSGLLDTMAAAGIRAVAPDMRGYGGTDCPEGLEEYRLPKLIGDVVDLARALGRDRFHLAGHDWGALIGWSVASHRSELVLSWSALSVGHPDAFAEAIRVDEDQRRRSAYIRLFRERGGKAEAILSEDGFRRLRGMYRYGPHPEAVPPALIDRFVAGFSRPGRLTAALNYYRAAMGREAAAALPPAPKPVVAPTQLIWGDEDPAVGRVGTENTAAHVTGPYRLLVLAGAGHWLQFERPAEVGAAVTEWIAAH